MTCHRNR